MLLRWHVGFNNALLRLTDEEKFDLTSFEELEVYFYAGIQEYCSLHGVLCQTEFTGGK